jgi:NAD(P)-dependent dehydrogenase (short-subunit alcohol dehydrogenase family)
MRALIGQAVEKCGASIACSAMPAARRRPAHRRPEVARFDAAVATLVRSVMLGMKHAAPYASAGFRSITNSGSIADGWQAIPPRWSMARLGSVIHLTKCVAMELGEVGIRVNSISPGGATGIFGRRWALVEAAEKTPELMQGPDRRGRYRAPGCRKISPRAAVFRQRQSTFINGHDLVVDGAITGGRNWTQQQQGYVALRKAFDQGKG